MRGECINIIQIRCTQWEPPIVLRVKGVLRVCLQAIKELFSQKYIYKRKGKKCF